MSTQLKSLTPSPRDDFANTVGLWKKGKTGGSDFFADIVFFDLTTQIGSANREDDFGRGLGVDMQKHNMRTRPGENGDVAQVVRACGSYPQCPGFKSLHRHHL